MEIECVNDTKKKKKNMNRIRKMFASWTELDENYGRILGKHPLQSLRQDLDMFEEVMLRNPRKNDFTSKNSAQIVSRLEELGGQALV